jgi:hypothetical protein
MIIPRASWRVNLQVAGAASRLARYRMMGFWASANACSIPVHFHSYQASPINVRLA